MKIQGIYKITNKINGKIYIGSSCGITSRWDAHINNLISKKHTNESLLLDYISQGENINNFMFEIVKIDNNLNKDELKDLEHKHICDLKSYNESVGYNKLPSNFEKDKEITLHRKTEIHDFINSYKYIDDYVVKKIIHNVKLTSILQFKKYQNDNMKYIKDDNFLSKHWLMRDANNITEINNLLKNYFKNKVDKDNSKMWTTYTMFKDDLRGKGYSKSFKFMNNDVISDADNIVFVANIFPQSVNISSLNKISSGEYALSYILNWIIRNINLDKYTELFIPSLRMYNILNNYLNKIE